MVIYMSYCYKKPSWISTAAYIYAALCWWLFCCEGI